MPNLSPEEDLRSSLDNIRGFDSDNPADGEVELFNIEKLVKLIHHYATKRELEARIDELNHIYPGGSDKELWHRNTEGAAGEWLTIESRLAELKAQRKSL